MDVAATTPNRRIDLAGEAAFRVGAATIDPVSRDASFEGGKERLQPQNVKVLIALSQKTGEAVRREELIERCWDGRIVGEDVINRSISTLRQFAKRAGGFAIETVPRCGYRLIEAPGAARKIRARWLAAAGGAAVLAVAGGWYVLDGPRPPTSADMPTIAVLPLTEDSSNRETHDVAGATRAALSYALTQGGYPVALVEKPASKLQPDLLISGDVQRTASSISAFVRVEETRDGIIVYSHRFEADRSSAGGLPDQIGASVAANLSSAARLMNLDRRHPSDPAVLAQILNAGSLAADSGDDLHAYEVARQLAPRTPNSAVAQFSLASEAGDALAELPRDQRPAAVAAGRAAASRLLKLAPDFGDAYGLWCGLHSSAYLTQCEDQMRRGIAADPNAVSVAGDLGMLLNAVGRVDEAFELDQVSLAKDPLNPAKLAKMVRLLEEEGYAPAADRLFRQAVRWWPDYRALYWSRLVGIEARGDYAELERYEREVDGDKLPLDRAVAAEVIAAARARDRAGAGRACASDRLRWTTQFLCVTALADLGELDRSFAMADTLFPSLRTRNAADEERAWLDQPSAFSIAVLSSPAAASLRRDPRFLRLVDDALLPYWRGGRLPDFCRAKPEPVCASFVRGRA